MRSGNESQISCLKEKQFVHESLSMEEQFVGIDSPHLKRKDIYSMKVIIKNVSSLQVDVNVCSLSS